MVIITFIIALRSPNTQLPKYPEAMQLIRLCFACEGFHLAVRAKTKVVRGCNPYHTEPNN